MAVIQKDLGPVTAYAAAVSAGYTGTKEEFEALMASYATVAQNAAASATAAASSALQAEGWASGTQSGVDVDSESPYYHKDAEYLANQANQASTAASTNALKAEGWAAGTQNGTAVPQNSPYYHNDSAYLAGQADASADAAAESATNAETSALKAEGFTEGTQNGTAVENSSEYYQHNMKYYKEHIDSVRASIPLEYDELSADVVQLQEDMENKAEVDGYYETMTVGDAEQLVSTMYEEDKGVYNFRTSGGSADIGNREQEMIVGGTIGWNQGIDAPLAGTAPRAGLTVTWDGQGNITFSGTVTESWAFARASKTSHSFVKDHKYLLTGCPNGGSEPTLRLWITSNAAFPMGHRLFDIGNGAMLNALADETGCVCDCMISNIYAGDITKLVFTPQLFDLTQMFGSTIADYIYGLEQANAGAGVAWFRKLFPKPYYAYNAGTLMSVKALKHQMTGFNQWDEEWESGIWNSTGNKLAEPQSIRSKNYIPVIPNSEYYIQADYVENDEEGKPTGIIVRKYDALKNFIGTATPPRNAPVFTTDVNCNYITFCTYSASKVMAYNHDICINLSWSGYRNGEYEPYELHTVELDPDLELRGIPKLDEDGHLVYDGDTYESDGKVTRRYGVVTFDGSESWFFNAYTDRNRVYVPVSDAKPASRNIFGNYIEGSVIDNLVNPVPYQASINSNGYFIIGIPTTIESANDWKTYLNGHPLTVIYELAEPTEETAEIYANPQWVNDFGTEEYVDAGVEAGDRDVVIPVGHETKYTANLRDKLQHLPDTAEEDGQYLIKQEGKQMRLVKDTKAEVDGYYEELTAGSAEQLISSQLSNDQEPYVFRTAGGSADIGNRKNESIVGGTICWNQIYNKATADVRQSYSSIVESVTGGFKITCDSTLISEVNDIITFQYTRQAGHKYLFFGSPQNASTDSFYLRAWSSGTNILSSGAIVSSGSTATDYLYVRAKSPSTLTGTWVFIPQIFDLTAMFGSIIADYVYSLEQATAGAGVAWFRKLFPKPYYAYNAGELMSVKAAAMETVGFNQWDEEWEVGTFSTATGEKTSAGDRIRNKNKIAVFPNTVYYFGCSVNATFTIFKYQADGSFIRGGIQVTNGTFRTPADCYYINFAPATGFYGNTYKGDIRLNLSWSGYRNGEYEPYVKRTYPLDSSLELRGIPKLSADNTMYFDGDTYEPDGTVTRRYGIVDLGTLTWGIENGVDYKRFISSAIQGLKAGSRNAGMMIVKYSALSNNEVFSSAWDKVIYAANGAVMVHDSAYSSSTAADFKSAMSGVYLVYELATPTTEEAEPFQSPQIVDDFGTERFIDAAYEAEERDVEIPVGHSTDYMVNLRDKLQHLPDLADGNGTYVVVQNNNQLSLTPLTTPTELPEAPTTNGTYTLKVTVANGTPTYSWVSG